MSTKSPLGGNRRVTSFRNHDCMHCKRISFEDSFTRGVTRTVISATRHPHLAPSQLEGACLAITVNGGSVVQDTPGGSTTVLTNGPGASYWRFTCTPSVKVEASRRMRPAKALPEVGSRWSISRIQNQESATYEGMAVRRDFLVGGRQFRYE